MHSTTLYYATQALASYTHIYMCSKKANSLCEANTASLWTVAWN